VVPATHGRRLRKKVGDIRGMPVRFDCSCSLSVVGVGWAEVIVIERTASHHRMRNPLHGNTYAYTLSRHIPTAEGAVQSAREDKPFKGITYAYTLIPHPD